MIGLAVDLFEGETEAAGRWLNAPQRGLGGEVPLELAKTDIGARMVENLIGRLEEGASTSVERASDRERLFSQPAGPRKPLECGESTGFAEPTCGYLSVRPGMLRPAVLREASVDRRQSSCPAVSPRLLRRGTFLARASASCQLLTSWWIEGTSPPLLSLADGAPLSPGAPPACDGAPVRRGGPA